MTNRKVCDDDERPRPVSHELCLLSHEPMRRQAVADAPADLVEPASSESVSAFLPGAVGTACPPARGTC